MHADSSLAEEPFTDNGRSDLLHCCLGKKRCSDLGSGDFKEAAGQGLKGKAKVRVKQELSCQFSPGRAGWGPGHPRPCRP